MSHELTTWLATGPVQREQNRQLARVHRDTTVAQAQVAGIVDVAHQALLGTGLMSLTKRQLEQLAPEDAGKLDFIETTAVVSMAGVIGRLGRP